MKQLNCAEMNTTIRILLSRHCNKRYCPVRDETTGPIFFIPEILNWNMGRNNQLRQQNRHGNGVRPLVNFFRTSFVSARKSGDKNSKRILGNWTGF